MPILCSKLKRFSQVMLSQFYFTSLIMATLATNVICSFNFNNQNWNATFIRNKIISWTKNIITHLINTTKMSLTSIFWKNKFALNLWTPMWHRNCWSHMTHMIWVTDLHHYSRTDLWNLPLGNLYESALVTIAHRKCGTFQIGRKKKEKK